MIPYARQDIDQTDIDAVVDILRSDFLTQGPAVPRFETAVADYCDVRHAVAVSNATSALHIACLALGVGKGDIVWTSPITFVATANCALHCEASIDFVDIEALTYNLSVDRLAEKLALAERTRSLPKVVIPVHLCGQPCDMARIHALGQRYGFKIIEDASHAIGGRYKDEPIGNCHYSDITVLSFHPVKIITSGEGGMALTNDPQLAKRMRRLRSHGITNDTADMHSRAPDELWNYQQIDLGFNFRLTDIQAALGLSQMGRIEEFLVKRRNIAKRYDHALAKLPLVMPFQHQDGISSRHLYVIRIETEAAKKSRREIYEAMHAEGILVSLHYIPVYRHPFYEYLGFNTGHCPQAEKYYSTAISIPMYSELTAASQDSVISALTRAFDE